MSTEPDRIELWVIPTDQPATVVERLAGLLDRSERDRAAQADQAGHGDRFRTVHGAVRLLAAERLGLGPAALTWSYGRHGKPGIAAVGAAGLQLSYSASDSLAVLALAQGRRVGADVEQLRDERVAARVAVRYFSSEDARYVTSAASAADRSDRFTRLWCRREACVKVYGGRLAQGLDLRLAGVGPLLLPDVGRLDDGPCRVQDVPVSGAFRAAVAAEGSHPFRIRVRHWNAESLAGESLTAATTPLQHSSTT